jgi:hypothetical protein
MKLRNMVLGLVAVLAAVPAMAGGIDGKWGKLKGDELALTSAIDMGQGPQETELVAKRVVARG